jgi:hypothetical protein
VQPSRGEVDDSLLAIDIDSALGREVRRFAFLNVIN